MATLHIEHPVSDFATWRAAFDRFDDARRAAGVRAARVSRPVDDPRYVVVGLDFESTDAAAGFLRFLQQNVWSDPANSPALVGSPRTMILES